MQKFQSGGGISGSERASCISVIGFSDKPVYDCSPKQQQQQQQQQQAADVGVGKSCLCNRFVRPAQDEFRLKHISTVHEADFAGQVLRNSHWIYWGCVERRPGQLCHVVEQTEFVNDKDLRPFPSNSPYYVRCTLTKLHASQKLAWVCSDQLGFENDYPKQRAPDGSLLVDGFLVCVDLSRDLSRQIVFLHEVAPLLQKTKRPALLVATKVDCLLNQQQLAGFDEFSNASTMTNLSQELDRLRKECRKFRCFVSGAGKSSEGVVGGGGGGGGVGVGGGGGGPLIVETSATLNVNVNEAFQYLLALIERDKARPSKPAQFLDALSARRALCNSAIRAYHRLLERTVKRHTLFQSFHTWQASHSSCSEFLQLIELHGSPRARVEFDRCLCGPRRDAVCERRRAIAQTLQRYLERVVPDHAAATKLANLSWQLAVDSMLTAAAAEPHLAAYLVDTSPLAWHNSVAYLNAPDDVRIPFDYLADEISARPVFEAHLDRLKAQQRSAELRANLLAAMKSTPDIRWGTPIEQVASAAPDWEKLTEELGPADVAKAYAELQSHLQRRALSDLYEAMMELAGYFYRPHTGRDSLANQADQAWQELAKRVDPDRAASLLGQRNLLNDALLRYLEFVRSGGNDGCFYDALCVDRLVPDALNNCVGAAASTADEASESSSSPVSSDAATIITEAESPLLLLGPERLTQRFKLACRSICPTRDAYRLADRLYRLSFRSPRLTNNSGNNRLLLPSRCRHDYIGCVLLYSCRQSLASLIDLAANAPLLLEAQHMLAVRTGSDSPSPFNDPADSQYDSLLPSASSPSPAAASSVADSISLASNSISNSLSPEACEDQLVSPANSTPTLSQVQPSSNGGDFRIVVIFSPDTSCDAKSPADCSIIAELKSAGQRLAGRLNAKFLLDDSAAAAGRRQSIGASDSTACAGLARAALEHLLPASFYRRTPDMLYLHRYACQLSLICVVTCGENVAKERLARLVAALSGSRRSSACAYGGRSLAIELNSRRLLIRLASFHSAWRLCDSRAYHGALVAYGTDRRASLACATTLAGNIAHRMPVVLVAMQPAVSNQLDGVADEHPQQPGVRHYHLDNSGAWLPDFANECFAVKELTERRFQDRFSSFVVAANHRDLFVSPPPLMPSPASEAAVDCRPAASNDFDCVIDENPADDSVYSSPGSLKFESNTAPGNTPPIYSCPLPQPRPPLASQEICEVYADPPDAHQHQHQQLPDTTALDSSQQCDSTYAYTCNALPPGTFRLVNSRSDYCQYHSSRCSDSPTGNKEPTNKDLSIGATVSTAKSTASSLSTTTTTTTTTTTSSKSIKTFSFNSLARLARLGSSHHGNSNNNNSSMSHTLSRKTYLAVPAPPLSLADLPVCVGHPEGPVPQLVVTCIEFVERQGGLKTEGVYRLCGNASETSAVVDLLIREPASNLANLKPKPSICVVTSALKQLLMKLQPSLIPASLLNSLLKVTSTPRHYPNFQPIVAHYFANNLSQPALACLRYIVNHLHKISCYAAENRMTTTNLATCWIHTLLPPSDAKSGLACQEQLQSLVETLIRYPNLLLPP